MLNYSWKASPNRWGRLEFNSTFSIGFGNGLRLAVHDVDGMLRMAGRVANMRGDECEKPMSGTACVVRP